jgi:hypothetical protein
MNYKVMFPSGRYAEALMAEKEKILIFFPHFLTPERR